MFKKVKTKEEIAEQKRLLEQENPEYACLERRMRYLVYMLMVLRVLDGVLLAVCGVMPAVPCILGGILGACVIWGYCWVMLNFWWKISIFLLVSHVLQMLRSEMFSGFFMFFEVGGAWKLLLGVEIIQNVCMLGLLLVVTFSKRIHWLQRMNHKIYYRQKQDGFSRETEE